MARTNVKKEPILTHEGAKAVRINPELQLRRSVLSCLLWENEHYEDGQEIADRIKELIKKVSPDKVASLAIEARESMKLRHIPLFIVREMARLDSHKGFVAKTLERVIQRADELTEFLAIYWKDDPDQPISAQVKKGLAEAFCKFNEYDFAKYNRDTAIKFRDVAFLCHPRAGGDKKLGKTIAQLVNKTFYPEKTKSLFNVKEVYDLDEYEKLPVPDTWEVQISKHGNKAEVWERLIKENKLGALAYLRNLRNMLQSNVDLSIIKDGLSKVKIDRVLPFRFITAARYSPKLESELEKLMLKCLASQEKLLGKTVLVVDVSGSMTSNLSYRSELTRMDTAFALSILLREICDDIAIYATAGDDRRGVHATELVPSRHGFSLSDVMRNLYTKLGGGGIFLTQCLNYIYEKEKMADRIIVITDEQDCDNKLTPESANAFGKMNYLINIASATNGIGYRKWVHIDGFSESVVNYIVQLEKSPQN